MKNAAAREAALSDDVIKTCNGDGDQSPGLHSETGIAAVRRGSGPSNFVSVPRYELRILVFRFSKKNS